MGKFSFSEKLFNIFNYFILGFLALICVLPVMHVLALSLSSKSAATAGVVGIWPVEFTFKSYEFIFKKAAFVNSIFVSLQRVLLGVTLNMLLTVFIAYPLSKSSKQFKLRTAFVWYFFFTVLFNGGLIPTYMTVKATGMIDSIWALVVPSVVPVSNVLLLLNFFRGLPKELEESALIDGSNHLTILLRIFLPISLPCLAILVLYSGVFHWNSWFDGMIYLNSPGKYPLQTYLQSVIIRNVNIFSNVFSIEETKALAQISDRTIKAGQIFVGTVPILCMYPFLQKLFVKGIVVGSVKG